MPNNTIATTSEAGRVVASNLQARRQAARREVADTSTPLFPETVGAVPLESLPEPPAAAPAPKAEKYATITIEVAPDGLHIRAAFTGSLASIPAAVERLKAAGVLDLVAASRATPAPTVPIATSDDLPDGWKLCRKHGAPMRPRQKQGDTWHSHNVGTEASPVWCKGYKGADSPGYDVD